MCMKTRENLEELITHYHAYITCTGCEEKDEDESTKLYDELQGILLMMDTYGLSVCRRFDIPVFKTVYDALAMRLGEIAHDCIEKQKAEKLSTRADLVLQAWPIVIGPGIAPMARAICFVPPGKLKVEIDNYSLYNLCLNKQGKELLNELRRKVPTVLIVEINFILSDRAKKQLETKK